MIIHIFVPRYSEAEIWGRPLQSNFVNFDLIQTFRLIFVTVSIHNILLWLNAGMYTPASMVTDILNNALFHSSPCTRQSDAASNPSRPVREGFDALKDLYSGLVAEFCSKLDWGQGGWTAANLEVCIGVIKISEIIAVIITFRVEAANG